jgi:hypothetical protein
MTPQRMFTGSPQLQSKNAPADLPTIFIFRRQLLSCEEFLKNIMLAIDRFLKNYFLARSHSC